MTNLVRVDLKIGWALFNHDNKTIKEGYIIQNDGVTILYQTYLTLMIGMCMKYYETEQLQKVSHHIYRRLWYAVSPSHAHC